MCSRSECVKFLELLVQVSGFFYLCALAGRYCAVVEQEEVHTTKIIQFL